MLPTNKKSKLVLSYCNELAINWTYDLAKFDDATYQHLYILSDEEIKEGDWVYDKLNNKVYQANSIVIHNMKSMEYEIFLEKIIATTDKSLAKTIKLNYIQFGDKVEETRLEFLPQPSQQFIEKFVEEYNKGNVITDVMVEYEELSYQKELDKPIHKGLGVYRFDETVPYNKLKISKDNTITIRKVKDSWSRDEVENLMRQAAYQVQLLTIGDFDKWIEENL